MHIYVDADAFPNAIKELLFRASERKSVPVTFVAGQYVRVPKSDLLFSVAVPEGADAADHKIVGMIEEGDLAITADIPLAARVVEKKAFALNPRGEFYTEENVKQKLAMRNFMEEMRSAGEITGGPKSFAQKDRQQFANALDRFLTQHVKQ